MIERRGVRWRLVTHAIVSREGRIADADGAMPPCLRVEEDQKRFQAALGRAVLTILGREGHERHPPRGRRRLVLTSRVDALAPDGDAVLWNPRGISLADALEAAAPEGGEVVNAGGTRAMTRLLPHTSRFELAIAHRCSIPGGRPCLEGATDVDAIIASLEEAGLALADETALAPGVTLRVHRR